jgi:SAM-dependent methyltransferase
MRRALIRRLAMSSKVKDAAIGGRLKLVVRALRVPPVGYLAFMLNLILKKFVLFFGEDDQRAAEYPWILSQLSLLPEGANVLDVGCSESILSHVLVMRGFRVTGLDLRDYPFRSKQMLFVKRNIADTGFPEDVFDGIVLVSTIEHVGLQVYGQSLVDSTLDVKAMHELIRILKFGGLIMITTPFVGREETRITRSERQYGFGRLEKLIDGLEILREDYFSVYRHRHALRWIKHDKDNAERLKFNEAGIACMVLSKTKDSGGRA